VDIYEDFMTQIKKSGIQIDTQTYEEETQERLKRIARKGGVIRNDGKSVVANDISPACVACKTGVGSATFFISLRCHRNCFYCFNPNQEGYDYFLNPKNKRNLIDELNLHKATGMKISHMALTGGEPLLYPDETIAFFRHAKELYPEGYTRLYTSGDHANETLLTELRNAGLDEIRFSIRLHDQEQGIRHTLDRISLAKKFIPFVMVEMPIVPGEVKAMKDILRKLDSYQIFSINLLEFCYPYYNTDVFNKFGYRVKKFPYKILYNYWYAGGLPVSQSELDCLELIEFVLDEDLSIGVHYCSLENKHTGQIYQANHGQAYDQIIYFSKKDYFLKTAKVFADDIPDVRKRLSKDKGAKYQYNEEHNYLEFQVHKIKELKGFNVEVGISSSIMEVRENNNYLRELKIDLCHPDQFDFSKDV
jgi:pyruvate formate-lyase activating enzyme-like uncharacterized protein